MSRPTKYSAGTRTYANATAASTTTAMLDVRCEACGIMPSFDNPAKQCLCCEMSQDLLQEKASFPSKVGFRAIGSQGSVRLSDAPLSKHFLGIFRSKIIV